MPTLWVLSRTASLVAVLGLAVAPGPSLRGRRSGAVALGPGAGAQPAVTADALVGVWQFHPPPCGSGNAMGLDADGSVWITGTYSGPSG